MIQKLMFRLLPVQILLASVGNINGIVSSLFAGNFVGLKAMTAVGLYSPYNLAIVAVTAMLVGGSTIVCGEHIGRNDQAGIQNTFALDIVLAGIISLIVTAAHLIFALVGSITRVSDDPDINRMLIIYVIGQAIGVIPLCWSHGITGPGTCSCSLYRTVGISAFTVANSFLSLFWAIPGGGCLWYHV